MTNRIRKNGWLALGALAVLAGLCPAAHAAAIGINSPAGGPVTYGSDTFDGIALQGISNTGNQVLFKATLIGGELRLDDTQAFTFFTDASNQIRDVLFMDIADDGETSTLYFDYVAHGQFGTVDAPTGTIVDPETAQTISLASLPRIAGVSEATTHAGGGYIVNGDLRDATTGLPSAFVPYLAVYLYADEPSAAAPEPASLLLLPLGLAGVFALRRKRSAR